jgi:hypothetical protein
MWRDFIVEEVRAAREAYARRFNYDLDAIYRDLKEQEKKGGRTTVSFPPRRVRTDQNTAPSQRNPSRESL